MWSFWFGCGLVFVLALVLGANVGSNMIGGGSSKVVGGDAGEGETPALMRFLPESREGNSIVKGEQHLREAVRNRMFNRFVEPSKPRKSEHRKESTSCGMVSRGQRGRFRGVRRESRESWAPWQSAWTMASIPWVWRSPLLRLCPCRRAQGRCPLPPHVLRRGWAVGCESLRVGGRVVENALISPFL